MIRRLTYTSPRSHFLASTSHIHKALSVPEQVRLLRHADEPYKYKGKTVVHGSHCTGGWLCSCLTFWLGLVQLLYLLLSCILRPLSSQTCQMLFMVWKESIFFYWISVCRLASKTKLIFVWISYLQKKLFEQSKYVHRLYICMCTTPSHCIAAQVTSSLLSTHCYNSP